MNPMRRKTAWPALLLALCLFGTGCGGRNAVPETSAAETETAAENTDETKPMEAETEEPREMTTEERAAALRDELWTKYRDAEKQNADRIAEDEKRSISWGGVTMKYGMKVVGEPGENGLYPLYIALHGGGSDETGLINEDQWRQMAVYYLDEVKSGVYVNPRAVRDTWDCHSNSESFPIYDRLIENMILFHDVDPDRVYLLGFSAGGDGVYQITPRMTDRFAAANMSAGHPNGVKLDNLYNMPLQLQVGINDSSYNRNKVTAEYDLLLDKLTDKYGGGYIHKTNIHIGYAHNFADYDGREHEIVEDVKTFFRKGTYTSVKSRTGAIGFLNQYTRDPLPDTLVWNLATRADRREVESFYWLSAPMSAKTGVITARCDREANTVTVTADKTADLSALTVLLSARVFDFTKDIILVVNETTYTVSPQIRAEVMEETLAERGDPSFIFEDRISLGDLLSAGE